MRAEGSTSVARAKTLAGISLAVLLLASGCESKKKADIPNYEPPPVTIVETNPNAETQCKCENSTGAYAQNTSSTSRVISYSIYTKDTFSGEMLKPIRGTASVPPAGPSGPGKTFLGCAIHAPTTQCRFQAKYSRDNYSSLVEVKAPASIAYGAVSTPSIASCTAWCLDPSNPNAGSCLPLGVRYYKAIAPLTEAIKSTQAAGGTLKQAEVLKIYGLNPSDDKCNRGDITTSGGRIVNEGQSEACVFRSDDLPVMVLQRIGIDKSPPSNLQLVTSLQRRVEAIPSSDIRSLNATNVVIFDQSEAAPIFTFDGPGGAKLTKAFGGHILGTARISSPGGARHTVVATANGCLAIDEP